jgi:hypothetical protein
LDFSHLNSLGSNTKELQTIVFERFPRTIGGIIQRCLMSKYAPDTPLRLDVAVREAFPAGGMTVSGLRKEIAKGHLEVELIAGKQFTTLLAIARMRELCRVPKKREPLSQPEMMQAASVARQQRLLARLEEDQAKFSTKRKQRCLPRTKKGSMK